MPRGVIGASKGLVGRLNATSERCKAALLNRVSRINPAPVFVLGNQKSGTSAIAALLAAAAGTSATIDVRGLRERAVVELLEGRASFPGFVARNRLDFSRGIVKEPNLTFFYRELSGRFPASKVVFVVRDPRANLRSILNRLSLPGYLPYLSDAQVEGVEPRWRRIFEGGWFGLEGENYVGVLAARWNAAADAYLENARNMTLIRYEDFCKDKAGEIAGLARRVGLEPVNDVTHKVDRQYGPRGDRSVSWPDFFGTDNLARIEHRCGEQMRKFGYVPGGG